MNVRKDRKDVLKEGPLELEIECTFSVVEKKYIKKYFKSKKKSYE